MIMTLAVIVVALVAVNLFSRWRDRKDPRRRKRPGVGRPVRRFKKRVRGFHVRPKETVLTGVSPGGTGSFKGVDHKNWVRLYPNPGYRIKGWHQCRHTHRRRVRWEEK